MKNIFLSVAGFSIPFLTLLTFGSNLLFESHFSQPSFQIENDRAPAPTSAVLLAGCGETIYDPGGPNGNFEPGQSETMTICPDNPDDFVGLRFNMWDVGVCCGATLEIYQGSTTDILIFTFNGSQAPTFHTGFVPGCVTLVFTVAANGVSAPGWEADILCSLRFFSEPTIGKLAPQDLHQKREKNFYQVLARKNLSK